MNIIGSAGIRIIPNMSGFGPTIGAAVAGSAGALTRAGAAMSVLITAPIVAGMAIGISNAVSFETAFSNVKRTVEATPAEFARLEQGIRDMAKEMPYAREELALIMSEAGKFGVATEDLLEFTTLAAQFGTAVNMPAGQAAEMVQRLINILGTPASETENFFSSIVGLGNDMPTTEANIISMATRLAQIGSVANVSEGDVLGMAAGLSSLGIRAEMGGSAMARVFYKIDELVNNGGADLEAFTKQFGLTKEAFAAKWESDPTGAVTDFLRGVQGLSEEGANLPSILKEFNLGEIRVRDTILRSAQGLDTWEKGIRLGNDAYEDGTALSEEYNKKADTTAAKWQMLKNRASDVALTLGQSLLPILLDVFDVLLPFFELLGAGATAFSNLDPEFRKFIISIGLAVAAIGPMLWIGTRLIGMVSNISGAFMLLSANPWILLAAAVVAAAVVIILKWDEVKKFLSDTWDAIKGKGQELQDFFTGFWDGINFWDDDKATAGAHGAGERVGEQFREGWDSVVNTANDAWFQPVMDAGNAVANAGGDTRRIMEEEWKTNVVIADTAAKGISDKFHYWMDPLAESAGIILEAMGVDVQEGTGGISQLWNTATHYWQYVSIGASETIKDVWGGTSLAVINSWANAEARIRLGLTGLKTMWDTSWDAISNKASMTWTVISTGVIQPAVDYWMPLLSAAATDMKEDWATVWGGMQNAASTGGLLIESYIVQLWGKLNLMKIGIQELWTMFDNAWQAMPVGVAIAVAGIKNSIEELKSAVRGALGPVDDLLGKISRIPGAGGATGFLEKIIPYDTGGVVPGPVGAPQLALVHGGETILPTHRPNWAGSYPGEARDVRIEFTGPVSIGSNMDVVDVGRRIGREAARELRAQGERGR